MKDLKIKRIYEAPSSDDGVRVLVDRLWPRGVSKERADLSFWFKDVAPSPELRIWFAHKSERFEEFSKNYVQELKEPEPKKDEELGQIKTFLKTKNVTLLYGAKDPKINHAIVLKGFVEGEL